MLYNSQQRGLIIDRCWMIYELESTDQVNQNVKRANDVVLKKLVGRVFFPISLVIELLLLGIFLKKRRKRF